MTIGDLPKAPTSLAKQSKWKAKEKWQKQRSGFVHYWPVKGIQLSAEKLSLSEILHGPSFSQTCCSWCKVRLLSLTHRMSELGDDLVPPHVTEGLIAWGWEEWAGRTCLCALVQCSFYRITVLPRIHSKQTQWNQWVFLPFVFLCLFSGLSQEASKPRTENS